MSTREGTIGVDGHFEAGPGPTVFLFSLALGVLTLGGLMLGFILAIDPYGVSPLQVAMRGVNTMKPARLEIDRQIKPYEVWWRQPTTVFLGTSRVHQSFDPAVLDGSSFAPAYNAAIPASLLSENEAHLKLFTRLDGKIRHVFMELFLYSFIYPQTKMQPRSILDLVADAAALQFSSGALWDAVLTYRFNESGQRSPRHVTPEGYWVPAPDFDSKAAFDQDAFINGIMAAHRKIPDMIVQPTAVSSFNDIVDLCRSKAIELHPIMTPNHPRDDYRLMSLGYWPLVEGWLRLMSTYDNVVSFSQYNELIEEPAGAGMKWWYDPIHPSLAMGRLMMRAIKGEIAPEMPANFMWRVTPETVESIIAERRAGALAWAKRNPDFAAAFERAKKTAGGPVERRPY